MPCRSPTGSRGVELWVLRPEIYLFIAQDLGQVKATRRINALTPLFRGGVAQASAPSCTEPPMKKPAAAGFPS